MYLITVTRHFAAAHAIRLPDGSLEPLHGHDWAVEVTVSAEALDAIETVMDFHALEVIVDGIIAPARNRNLNEIAPFAARGSTPSLAMNPTAERVAWWIATQTMRALPPHVALQHVRVEEATGCFAIYEA